MRRASAVAAAAPPCSLARSLAHPLTRSPAAAPLRRRQTTVPYYKQQPALVGLEYVNGLKQEFDLEGMEVRDLIEEISASCAVIETEYMAKGLPVPEEDDGS